MGVIGHAGDCKAGGEGVSTCDTLLSAVKGVPMRRLWLGISLCTISVLLALAAGCSGVRSEDSLIVAAAASLAPAFESIGEAFAEREDMEILFSYGATANLAEQIRNGGPYDIFFSADALHVDELIDEGYLDPESRTVFAQGRLVLAVASGVELTSLEGLLDPSIRHVALANPAFAPYGLAAKQALERAGLWDRLQPKIIYGESVRQVGQMLASGNASAGLLAASTTIGEDLRAVELPADLYDPIVHVAGVRRGSLARPQAEALLAYLASDEGAIILDRFGFSPVSP